MTAAGVNAAEPRPLPVVPCGLLRHGNANDLHVRARRREAQERLHWYSYRSRSQPSTTEQRAGCFCSPAPSWERAVRARGNVNASKRLSICTSVIVEEHADGGSDETELRSRSNQVGRKMRIK